MPFSNQVTRWLLPTGLLRTSQDVKEKPDFRLDDINTLLLKELPLITTKLEIRIVYGSFHSHYSRRQSCKGEGRQGKGGVS